MRYLVSSLILMIGLSLYGCSDSASVSNEAQVPLASLTITPPGALQPAFSSNTTSYAAHVPTAVTSITVTASPKDSTATMTINGIPTAAGEGQSVSLDQPGSTKSIHIALASSTGFESTYTVFVTRLVSSDNNLSVLHVSAGSLDPAFAPGTVNYTVNVSNLIDSVTITATKADADAVMSGSVTAGTGVATGQATIPLGAPGSATPVSITVAAPSGLLKIYSLTINRLASTDSTLSALGVSAGSLDPPTFAPSTVNYTVNVGILIGSVTITATKSDPNAVMSALGSVISAAGTPTGQVIIYPGLGPNPPVNILVIAQDGVTSTTYSVTVTRGLF
ncbi:MAG: cadherin-like beta sandwich domain-containing protein [Nitrospira sp.]